MVNPDPRPGPVDCVTDRCEAVRTGRWRAVPGRLLLPLRCLSTAPRVPVIVEVSAMMRTIVLVPAAAAARCGRGAPRVDLRPVRRCVGVLIRARPYLPPGCPAGPRSGALRDVFRQLSAQFPAAAARSSGMAITRPFCRAAGMLRWCPADARVVGRGPVARCSGGVAVRL